MFFNLRKTIFLLPALACLASCIETYPSVDQMTGIIDETFTRTSFVEDGIKLKTSWEYGDYIIVKSSRSSDRGKIDESGSDAVIIDDESGRGYSYITEYIEENKALFAIMDETEPKAPYTAFYPREICDYELPGTQLYKADGPWQAPMMAKAPTKYLLFKPICGAIEIKLSTTLENAVVKKIILTARQPLCGPFGIGDEFIAVAHGEKKLTLDCGAGVALGAEPKPFWFSVPQNTYTGVTVTLVTTDGRTQTFRLEDGQSIDVVRAEITTCPLNLQNLNKNVSLERAVLPTGLEFNRFLKKIANPEMELTEIEPMTPDANVTKIHFVTESSATDGDDINTAGDIPIYASFDKATGVMTVSTPAKEIALHRDGNSMFRFFTALTEVNLDAVVTDDLCNMTFMFNHCESLPFVDVTAIYPANIQDMDNCFSDCWAIDNLDFSQFRNDRLENIRSCFLRCYALSGKMDLSAITSKRIYKMGYTFQECKKLTSIDIRNIVPIATASDMSYMFYKVPCLEEIFLNDDFIAPGDDNRPSSFFAGTTEAAETRTASVPGKLTIHCSQKTADWLATTNLRWIQSGHSKKTPITVYFLDNATGNNLTVTWSAN